jgi:hypothetical protein
MPIFREIEEGLAEPSTVKHEMPDIRKIKFIRVEFEPTTFFTLGSRSTNII